MEYPSNLWSSGCNATDQNSTGNGQSNAWGTPITNQLNINFPETGNESYISLVFDVNSYGEQLLLILMPKRLSAVFPL